MEASRVDEIIRRWDLLRGEAHDLHKQVVELRAQLNKVEADARAQVHALAVAKGQIDRRLRRATAELDALKRSPVVKLLQRLTRSGRRPLSADQDGSQEPAAPGPLGTKDVSATIAAFLEEAQGRRGVVLLASNDPARAGVVGRELGSADLQVLVWAPAPVVGTLRVPAEIAPAEMDRILGVPGDVRAFVALGPSLHASRWFTSAQAIGWLGVACFEEKDLAPDDDGAGAFILRNADVVVATEGAPVVDAGSSTPVRSSIVEALTVTPWSPARWLTGSHG